jgi:Gpi18-like mannosyltransferase
MANLMYVVAYFTLDILRLRLLTTAAAICLAVYFYSQPTPLMNVVGWSVFFVLLNLVQIGRILKSRYSSSKARQHAESRVECCSLL